MLASRRKTRFLWAALLFLGHLVALSLGSPGSRRPPAVTELRVSRLDAASSVSLGEIAAGRPLLLVFWTRWCRYCIEELRVGPALVARLEAAEPPLAVRFVATGEAPAAVRVHPGIETLAPRVVLDPSGLLADRLGVGCYPTHVLLDRSGRPVWHHEGLHPDLALEALARARAAEHG